MFVCDKRVQVHAYNQTMESKTREKLAWVLICRGGLPASFGLTIFERFETVAVTRLLGREVTLDVVFFNLALFMIAPLIKAI
jgi:hypothetical protein